MVLGKQQDTIQGLLYVEHNNKVGAVNSKGEEFIPCKYEGIFYFYGNVAAVEGKNEKYGYVNLLGQEIVPCKYQWVDEFSGGMGAVVNESILSGYVNQKGEEVIPCCL